MVGPADTRLLFGASRLGLASQPLELAPQEILSVLLHALGVRVALGAARQVGRITALVARELPGFEFQRATRDPVEHVTVVRDQQQCAREAMAQVVFEPLDGCDVEVVRRFVEDREIGRADQQARERHPAPFASGQGLDGPVGVVEAEMVDHGFGFV